MGTAAHRAVPATVPGRQAAGENRPWRHRAGLLLLAVGLLCASCGARVGPYLGAGLGQGTGRVAAGAGTGTFAGGSVAGTPAAGASVAGGSVGAAPGAGGSVVRLSGGNAAGGVAPATAASGGGGSAPTASSFSFSPSAEAADCRGTAGNTASAPGVTPTSVTIGNVSGITGPLTGSFSQGPQAVQALFDAVDAAGGICGRKLVLDTQDDQQDSSTDAADVASLIPHVLAFVGSTSDADNGGVPAMEQAGVPDFGFAINCNRSESSTYWSPAGGSCAQPQGTGGPYYVSDAGFALAKADGFLPAKMAFLSYNIAISAQAAQQYEYVYQHDFGGSVCYSDFSISPATASLESDVTQMQADGCQGVLTTLDVIGNAKLLQAMAQQSYHLPFTYTTLDGYTPAQIQAAGQSAAQGLLVGLPFVPLQENQPAVDLYQQQLQTYEPGQAPSAFGFLAWEAGQLFLYALIAAGHNPTRASLTRAVASVTNWTGGGALGAYTPSQRTVAPCQVDVQVRGGTFVPKAPTSGLYCGGSLVQASP